MSLQAMDSSHVSLVSLLMRADGFEKYRCDRNINLGINMASMTKIMKCAANDDIITIRAEDQPDAATFTFESSGSSPCGVFAGCGRAPRPRLHAPDIRPASDRHSETALATADLVCACAFAFSPPARRAQTRTRLPSTR